MVYGAYLAVDSNGYIEEKGINLSKLGITSSTRAEVATIVEACNSFPLSNITIYTDSQVAIDQIDQINDENISWSKIGNIDLWCQLKNVGYRTINLIKVEGHSDDKVNEYVDYLTWQVHKYKPTTLDLKSPIFKRRKAYDKSHYRLHDVVEGIMDKSLDIDKFKTKVKELKKQIYLCSLSDEVTATLVPND